jgi:hypothetical protein
MILSKVHATHIYKTTLLEILVIKWLYRFIHLINRSLFEIPD